MREGMMVAEVRAVLSGLIADVQLLADEKPVYGAELTLAIRHLQDARMRLGVALTIKRGGKPWSS